MLVRKYQFQIIAKNVDVSHLQSIHLNTVLRIDDLQFIVI